MEEEQNTAKYFCIICRKRFTSTLELIQHKDAHPPHELRICFTCGRSFICLHRLKNHLRAVHRISYQCNMCNRHFTTPSSLSRHRETHFQVEHKCNFCNNSFKHWDYLREHLNICVARYKEN